MPSDIYSFKKEGLLFTWLLSLSFFLSSLCKKPHEQKNTDKQWSVLFFQWHSEIVLIITLKELKQSLFMKKSSTYPRLTVFLGVNSREWSSCKQRFLSTMLLAESLSLSPLSSPPSPCSYGTILVLGATSNRARFFSLAPEKIGSVAATNWPNLHKTCDIRALPE